MSTKTFMGMVTWPETSKLIKAFFLGVFKTFLRLFTYKGILIISGLEAFHLQGHRSTKSFTGMVT